MNKFKNNILVSILIFFVFSFSDLLLLPYNLDNIDSYWTFIDINKIAVSMYFLLWFWSEYFLAVKAKQNIKKVSLWFPTSITIIGTVIYFILIILHTVFASGGYDSYIGSGVIYFLLFGPLILFTYGYIRKLVFKKLTFLNTNIINDFLLKI